MIKKNSRTVSQVVVLLVVLVQLALPVSVQALTCPEGAASGKIELKCLEGIASNVFKVSIGLLLVTFFGVIIFGGIKYLTAGGDEKAIVSARKTIFYALFGLMAGLASYYLLRKFVFETLPGVGNIRFEVPESSFP